MPDQVGIIPATLAVALAARYRLEKEVGAGGMASVYLAQDLRHNRPVAIKVLHRDLTEALGKARFIREIDIAAGLAHPHILPLHDSGEADGRLYYVMPFVDGESLRQRLDRDGPLPIEGAVGLLRDVAEALDHADRRGVVHRDLKPANIMLAEGHAMVADFGVAKALHAAHGPHAGITGITGALAIGTPTYMSPEQTIGGMSVDHRSDLYAFGIVAYEVLTGRPPFAGETADVLMRHLAESATPVTEHRKEIPTALAMLVMRCLEKKPDDRWQHAAELLPTLDSLRRPSVGPPMVGAVPHRRQSDAARRRRRRRIAFGLGLVAVTVIMTASWYRASMPLPPPVIVRQTALTSEIGLELEPALSPDGKHVAYSDGPLGDSRIMIMHLPTRSIVPLAEASTVSQRFPQWTADGSQVAFLSAGTIWTAPAVGGGRASPLLRPGDGPPFQDFSLSHAGDRVAVVRDQRLSIMSVDERAPPIALDLMQASRPAWSPDDRWIAVTDRSSEYARGVQQFGNLDLSSLWLFSSDGTVRRPLTDSLDAVSQASPVWSGDGRRLFFVSVATGNRDIHALSLSRSGRPLGTPQRLTTGASPHSLAVAGDGTGIVYSAFHARSAAWRVRIPASGEARLDDAEQITHEFAEIHTLSASRDNRWLYYDAARDGAADLYRVRIGSWSPERLTDDPAGDFTPQLSPDGKEIVFQSHRNGNRDLFLMDSVGGRARPLLATPAHENYPSWSPDGSMIVYWRSPGVWLIRRDGRGGWSAPGMLSDSLGPPSWTPDGKGILTYGFDHIMRIDLATRRVDTLYSRGSTDRPSVNRPIMSIDGRKIYFKDREAIASFWAIPARGGTPRRVLRFDRQRPSSRLEYYTDGIYLYFTIDDRQADLWLLELAASQR